ncbi:asparagine synthetase B family protein [Sphingosinicella microcystinivorans]|uniref:Asparagine synthase n=2 Tax=Sphingosinicella microcystinivorans TaxID=335406 RepID=A0AAD1FYZ2_SPHMI|nr:asparagine synthetase B family protein [Sphingosinicella microcystinivorans]BBE32397.1 asparagine synthase [Sphingosinicella microcystinivorans]
MKSATAAAFPRSSFGAAPPAWILIRRLEDHDAARRREAALRLIVREAGLAEQVAQDGLLIASSHERVSVADDVVLIGDVFGRRGGVDMSPPRGDPADHAAWLVENRWGRYAAVFLGGTGPSLMRDPMGMMPLHGLEIDGVLVAAPDVPPWLRTMGTALRVDQTALAHALAHPPLLTWAPVLTGVRTLTPGVLHSRHAKGWNETVIWHPARFVSNAGEDAETLKRRLADRVDMCVAAWAARYPAPHLELSGGLDSAIVLSSLARAGLTPSATNFTTGYEGGDERRFARPLAERYGIRLQAHDARAAAIDYARLAGDVPGAAPQLHGLDPVHEQVIADHAGAAGASAILTGQGGDAVFFQMPSLGIAADLAVANGLAAFRDPLVLDLAARTARSAGRVLGVMLRERLIGTPVGRDTFDRRLLGSAVLDVLEPERLRHPWLAGLGALPPGKRVQLEAIANCQLFFTPVRRGIDRPLIHPLLSQPIVELCLSIPTWQLAPDIRDRGLARDAFRARLPEALLARRRKGEASTYYNRAIAENLPFLRDYLLGGRLAEMGLLDKTRLETALDADRMMHVDETRPVPLYVSFEAWLRRQG